MPVDLDPATDAVETIVLGVTDEQLSAPTPCSESTVADLLDHVSGLCLAFTWAADKTPVEGGSPGPSADGSRLGDDWRSLIPERLGSLAQSWSPPTAWQGMTEAGGIEMPGEIAGLVALDEVVIHGWDLAVATGQSYTVDADLLAAIHPFVASFDQPEQADARKGLFGPVVPVSDEAPLLDRILGLAGRDPDWTPDATS